jgi:chromosome segregation ATPase
VRCNDRSKPNLRGIKTFKRQLTKEEKDKKGFSFGEDALEEDLEDVTKIKDDLESTKQLLELEVRSKSLLEKDNKKLQAEIERLKDEFQKMQDGGQPAPEIMNSILSVRKDSVSKEGRRRKSSVATVVEVAEDMAVDEEAPEKPAAPVKSEEVIEEMEELKDEVDEARKLAEEWEAKYKEMQRQMSLLEEGTPFGKKNSTTGFEKPVLQRGLSTTSSDGAGEDGTGDKRMSQNFPETEVTGDDWMQKREVQQLRAKLKNVKDKKEMIVRERFLLTERVDSLKDSIAIEYEARKKLKKDVKDMNAAFKEEMEDMELDEDAQNDLDDCYFENEDDLVINSHRKKKNEDDNMDEYADFGEDDDLEESVEEMIKTAEESEEMEVDPGEDLFNKLKEEVVEDDLDDVSHEKQLEQLNKRVEEETEKVQTMRKSNFSVKAKIDILYDLLQTQKEKHYDLKQELNRMLSDIQ